VVLSLSAHVEHANDQAPLWQTRKEAFVDACVRLAAQFSGNKNTDWRDAYRRRKAKST
jgi:hypothetical protein